MTDEKKVLLAVLAHPDDETFGMGGTLAYYARQGDAVHLICATRGEVGEVDEKFMQGFQSIAERRESELRCAAGILGLAGVHFLGYRDSGMPGSPDNSHPNALAAAPLEEVASRVAHLIRQLQPQVVLTFDPIGGYKHPDHIAIQRATLRAFMLAGAADCKDELPPYQPQKLYYHVFPKGFLRWAVRIMPLFGADARHFGRNRDIDLAGLVEDGDFPTHVVVDIRGVLERKEAAAECHASQLGGGPPRRGWMRWVMQLWSAHENFMRAYPPAPANLRERDLFEGVVPGPG
jgi:LmbE family N-acetylglucosaminyl deacetylase